MIEPILDDVLAVAAEVGKLEDPLQAEMFSAGLRASLCDPARFFMQDGERALGTALVEGAEDAGGAASVALLRSVEATWPEPVASRASASADRLERRGVPAPPWADALRGIALESVEMAEDPHSDHALLVATFSYRGERRHCAVVLIGCNVRGMVVDAAITDELSVSAILEGLAPQLSSLELRAADAARGAATLSTGLQIRHAADSDIARLRERDPDQRAMLHLLDARLRTFPSPARDAAPRRASPRTCARVIADFLASDAGASPVEPERVEFVARQLVEFKVGYADGDPLRWSPMLVAAFMEEWFPRKVTADPEAMECLPAILRAWVRWAGNRRGIASGLVDETLAAVGGSERAFQEACRDRSRFMPAKAVATAMHDDGVDVTDRAAVDAWFRAFRRSSPGQRAEKLGQDLDVEGVFVDGDRVTVAITRPAAELAKDAHLLGA